MVTMTKTSAMSNTLRSRELASLENGSRALTNAAEQWIAASTECHREMIGFMSMRLEKDSDTFREMMECKNITDVATIQSRWMEETLRDYNSEINKLMTICAKSVNGGGQIGR